MLLLLLLFALGTASYVITPAPQPWSTPYSALAGQEINGMYGNQANNWLGRRQDDAMYNCDGHSIFFCPTAPTSSGTCYTGGDGYIGCCSISSCAARTTCVDYTEAQTASCDMNTGGCWLCTDSASPSCVTLSNTEANQHVFYCSDIGLSSQTGYVNPVTTGSHGVPPGIATPITASSTLSSFSSSSSSESPSTVPNTPSSGTATASSSTPSGQPPAQGHHLARGDVIGIAIGGTLAFILLIFLIERRDWIIAAAKWPRTRWGTPQPTSGGPRSPSEISRPRAQNPPAASSPQTPPGDPQPIWVVANEIDHPEGHELAAPTTTTNAAAAVYELESLRPQSAGEGGGPSDTSSPSSGKRVSFDPSLGLPTYPRRTGYASSSTKRSAPGSSSQSSVGTPQHSARPSPPAAAALGSASVSTEPSPTFPPSPMTTTAESGRGGSQRESGVSAITSGNESETENRNYTAYHPSARTTVETTTTSATGVAPGYQSPEEAMQHGFHDRGA